MLRLAATLAATLALCATTVALAAAPVNGAGHAAAVARPGAADTTAAETTAADTSAHETVADATAAPVEPSASATPSQPWRLVRTTFVNRAPDTPVAEPSGVLVDTFGRVWMSDAALHGLQRFETSGAALDQTGALGSEPGQFRRPGALARVGALGVAVLDVENRRVTVYDHHLRLLGAAIDLAAPALEARVGRVSPVGLTADRGGALYVADAERDRILVFDYAGTFQRELGGFGARAGGFSGLLAVAAGAHGGLVTVERPRGRSKRAVAPDTTVGRSRVQWLDAGGRVVASVWLPAWSAGAGETGLALAVDDSGVVAVVAERSGELVVLSSDGAVVARDKGLAAPRAVAFGAAGELLVAAAGEARLLRFTLAPPAAE